MIYLNEIINQFLLIIYKLLSLSKTYIFEKRKKITSKTLEKNYFNRYDKSSKLSKLIIRNQYVYYDRYKEEKLWNCEIQFRIGRFGRIFIVYIISRFLNIFIRIDEANVSKQRATRVFHGCRKRYRCAV